MKKNFASENLKFNPNEDLIILLDKIFRNVFNPSKSKTKKRKIVEKEKPSEIVSTVIFETLKGSLNQFDKFVFCAILSEEKAGNDVFTYRRLWRKMGGGFNLPDEMKEKIAESVEKLACTRVVINMSEINAKHHYTDSEEVIFRNYLLPCKSIEGRINGQLIDGLYRILDISPLFKIAELKKQYTSQPLYLLDVPKLKNTELVMKLKFYLLERITMSIGSRKKHKKHIAGKKKDGGFYWKGTTALPKIIKFETLFEQCEMSDADNGKKRDARNVIRKILNHFKESELITEWHFEKKNGAFYSICFD